MKTKPAGAHEGTPGSPAKRALRSPKTGAPGKAVDAASDAEIDPHWRWHYRTLLALRNRLMQETRAKREEATDSLEPHGMHVADSATDEVDHDVALALLAREESALRDVSDAITRILEGRYGVCEATGKKIPATRLRALPWCRYSVEAEREIERATHQTRCRIPEAVSLRGVRRDVPGTGTVTRQNSEGPAEEERQGERSGRAAEPTVEADVEGEEKGESPQEDTPER